MTDWLNRTHVGDCRDTMRRMAAEGVRAQMCVTSPPYYGLRDYGMAGQIGLEESFSAWIDAMVEVFECVRDALTDDGTLWLNLGDSYAGGGRGGNPTEASSTLEGGQSSQQASMVSRTMTKSRRRDDAAIPRSDLKVPGLKAKDLMGQPWRVAMALQAAGWYLRRDIIWHKPNPMPESAKDRPTTAHEYIFLLSKSDRYHYDAAAIAEPVTGGAHARGTGVNPKAGPGVSGWANGPGSHSAKDHAIAKADGPKFAVPRSRQNASFSAAVNQLVETRNARSVWTIPSEPTPFAHFACFPREIPKRCILAGSRLGDIVLDPFMGSGTTAQVATSLGRQFIGCELNPEYIEIQRQHRQTTMGLGL